MIIKAIAIDDDPMALLLVEKHALNNPKVELIATYDNSVKGAAGIILDKPDILFLDMEMPEFDGLQIMKAMVNPPKVIVISASPSYSERALALNAVTFIDKPLTQERFDSAIDQVKSLLEA